MNMVGSRWIFFSSMSEAKAIQDFVVWGMVWYELVSCSLRYFRLGDQDWPVCTSDKFQVELTSYFVFFATVP